MSSHALRGRSGCFQAKSTWPHQFLVTKSSFLLILFFPIKKSRVTHPASIQATRHVRRPDQGCQTDLDIQWLVPLVKFTWR